MPEPTFSGPSTGTDGPALRTDADPANLGSARAEGLLADAGGFDSTLSGRGTAGFEGVSPSTASDFNAAAADLQGPAIEIVDLSFRYDVLDRIGAGGMGEVYRGHDRKLNRPVAIKRLKAELARDARQLQRFVDEARTIATLSHAHIVHVYDYGRDAQGPFLILEFLEGESLAERLQRGPLDLQAALRLLIPICEAVTFAHSRKVIHRDIKPANIFIDVNGVTKLGDFGIARQEAASSHTVAGAVLGTFDYMSPEQLQDSTLVDGRSDLWSLACTLYETLTGKSPRFFEADNLPTNVREIVVRARRVRPEERYPSVEEFTNALRDTIADQRRVAESQELHEGECSRCHTVNPPERKFCKKHGCGAPLYENCPTCETRIPVWDSICGECGADVPATWFAREQEIISKSQLIEALSGEYSFTEAEGLLTEIVALEGPRWKEWRAWAESFSMKLQSEKDEQEALRDKLCAAAMKALESFQYAESLSLLKQIPDSVHSSWSRELLRSSHSKYEELEALLTELRRLVKAKQYAGLRSKIDRVLELSPGDERVAKLDQQLREREQLEATPKPNVDTVTHHTDYARALYGGYPTLEPNSVSLSKSPTAPAPKPVAPEPVRQPQKPALKQSQVDGDQPQELRRSLLADLYNASLRQRYLAIRTPDQILQDRRTAFSYSSLAIEFFLVLVFFGVLGAVGYKTAIAFGGDFGWITSAAAIAFVLFFLLMWLIGTRIRIQLAAEIGPLPHDNHKEARLLRKQLMGA